MEAVSKELVRCYSHFQLTLRDIERIVSTYKLMHRNFVKKYKNYLAHILYLHLLCIKYKRREVFESLTNDTLERQNEFHSLYQNKGRDHGTINNRIYELSNTKKIQMTIEKNILKLIGNVNYERRGKSNIVRNIDILYYKGKLSIELEPGKGGVRYIDEPMPDTILGYALFPEDLEQFMTIKARSIPEYIHHHMEFFDFETGLEEDSSN